VLTEELPFALVFDANGIMLRLAIVPQPSPSSGTVLGWQVSVVASAVPGLALAGVYFERYDFLPQDESGIWTTPNGARVAWFKDPDANLLNISQYPEATQ
jgi:hypothetical protein